jgi:hypothetical protein
MAPLMRLKCLLLALCLLLLSPAQAATTKNYNVQVDVLRYGLGGLVNSNSTRLSGTAHFAALTFSYYRLRFGSSLVELLPSGSSVLPVEAGITIYQRPRPYVWFRGMVPDVYAEVGYYYANGFIEDNPFGPVWKFGVRCEVDYWGVGAGAEVAYLRSTSSDYYSQRGKGLAANLYIRLLTTNFGF